MEEAPSFWICLHGMANHPRKDSADIHTANRHDVFSMPAFVRNAKLLHRLGFKQFRRQSRLPLLAKDLQLQMLLNTITNCFY
ncbi:hypothetical protein D3C80_432970 [compost metagenome]